MPLGLVVEEARVVQRFGAEALLLLAGEEEAGVVGVSVGLVGDVGPLGLVLHEAHARLAQVLDEGGQGAELGGVHVDVVAVLDVLVVDPVGQHAHLVA